FQEVATDALYDQVGGPPKVKVEAIRAALLSGLERAGLVVPSTSQLGADKGKNAPSGGKGAKPAAEPKRVITDAGRGAQYLQVDEGGLGSKRPGEHAAPGAAKFLKTGASAEPEAHAPAAAAAAHAIELAKRSENTKDKREIAGYYALSCNRSANPRCSIHGSTVLVCQMKSDAAFEGPLATPSYAPRSGRIITAQGKYTKEFGAAVTQHLAHLREGRHALSREGRQELTELPPITKERARTKLADEKLEGAMPNLHGPLLRLCDMRERCRRLEGSLKQFRRNRAAVRTTIIRLGDPLAAGADGQFTQYRDEGAVRPDAGQRACPRAISGRPSIYAGYDVTTLYNLHGFLEDILLLHARSVGDVEACALVAYLCTRCADLYFSFELDRRVCLDEACAGRHYEATAHKEWPTYNSGVAVDVGSCAALVREALGANLERYVSSAEADDPVPVTERTPEIRRSVLWDLGGDRQLDKDAQAAYLRLPCNGMRLTLENLIKMIEKAISILMVQKFQPSRTLELCQLEADALNAYVLAASEPRVRGARGELAEDSVDRTIAGSGTGAEGDQKNKVALFSVCWRLLPATPFQSVNPGPAVMDTHRLAVALDVALNKFTTYEKPEEMRIRAGFKA
ncbi:unnamed protein product, partial [Prorocentrum cordatum]